MNLSRILSVILICALNLFQTSAQEKRALVIGIGDYPDECGWGRIHGNNDVGLIHDMLIKLEFPERNISTLVDSDASYENILKEMQTLLDASKKNDIVYIHFSGHGQRITDLDGDETEDGLDEAWIPYDAYPVYIAGVYEGGKHITDDFLNSYLNRLRDKIGAEGKIIVIADACHSGSGSRGLDDDVFIRGSSDYFDIPNVFPVTMENKVAVDWLFVAACEDYQVNYEYRDEAGVYYGSLSYTIAKSSDVIGNILFTSAIEMWRQIMNNIKRYPQTIVTDGRPSMMSNYLF